MGDPSRAAQPPSHSPLPAIAWRMTAEGTGARFSPSWQAVTGQDPTAAEGIGWIDSVHPEDRGRIIEGWHRALTTGIFVADLRILTAPHGTYAWYRTQAAPADDDAGGWAGIGIDVSDLYQRLTGETTLRAALHHRIRNTLAVIRSIARRTAENSETVEDYRSHFDGRLAAFARTQSHIMRTGAEGVDLEGLLADELLAHQVGGRVSYSGPEVRLQPRLADQLGIALHELTDNAVQHGALAHDSGRLQVRWWVAGDAPSAMLHIDWHEEADGGGIVAPETEGFGLELLTRSLHYEVDAEVQLDFTDRGLRCSIRLPLT